MAEVFCSECGAGNESGGGLRFCVDCGAPLLAATYGRFEVRSLIGRGSAGVVVLAHDPLLDRLVALRVLTAHIIEDPQQFQRLEHAVQVMADTSHPHWVEVYDLDRGPPDIAVVMEYVDGVSLAALLDQEEPLAPQACAAGLAGALDGVDYLHRLGLIHGDLTPHNVLLDRHGDSKVGDVGVQAERDPGSIALGYVSPEQLRGEPATSASDVYALGALLFGMSTGHPPFPTSDLQTSLNARDTPVDTSTMHPGLAAIVTDCLQPDPAARPATVTDVSALLNDAATTEFGPTWRTTGTAMLTGTVIGALAAATGAAIAGTAAVAGTAGGTAAAAGTTATSTSTGILATLAAKPAVIAVVAATTVAATGTGIVVYEKTKQESPTVATSTRVSTTPTPLVAATATPPPTSAAPVPPPLAPNLAQGTTYYALFQQILIVKRSGNTVAMQTTEKSGPEVKCFNGRISKRTPTLVKDSREIDTWPYYFVGSSTEYIDGQPDTPVTIPRGFDAESKQSLNYNSNAGDWKKITPTNQKFLCP